MSERDAEDPSLAAGPPSRGGAEPAERREPGALPIEPSPPDQPKWDEAAVTFDLEQLKRIRETAEKWSGTITTLLGIFGTVAIIAGTDKLGDIRWDWLKGLIILLVIAAGYFASQAIIRTAEVAHGNIPHRTELDWGGRAYRSYVTTETPIASNKLREGRRKGYIAALLVFVIGLITLLNAALPAEVASSSAVVVVDKDGQLRCGKLDVQEDGTAKLDGKAIPAPARQVISVSKC